MNRGIRRARVVWIGRASYAVMLSLLLLAGCSRGRAEAPAELPDRSGSAMDEAIPVKVWTVERGEVEEYVDTVGNLAPLKRSILYAEVDGVVKEVARAPKPLEVVVDGQKIDYPLNVDIGVPVSKGQVILRLDPVPFELAVQQAEKQLLRAQRELERLLAWRRPEEIRQLEAQVEAARARLELDRATLARYQRLYEKGAASDEDLQRQVTQVRLAQAELQMAEASLEIARKGPTQEEIAVAQAAVEQARANLELARDRLARSVVRAPYDGIITETFVSEGERVTATPRTGLFEIVYVDVLVAQVAVPEKYYGLVHPQDTVQLFLANRNEPVPGVVAFVNGKVDYQTRTFRVRIGIDNRSRKLQPGQFVRARLTVRSASDAPYVPARAVRYLEGDPYVFVLEGGVARARPVRLGLANESVVQIVSGLNGGEQLIVEPVDLLSDGMRVQVGQQQAAVGSRVTREAGS